MSDKTTAAIAAEQQAEAPEAPAEALPAVTLDELEQVDLGTVEQGERAPFRIMTQAMAPSTAARPPVPIPSLMTAACRPHPSSNTE